MARQALTIAPRNIERLILLVRGEKVILDADLAALYGTTTKTLNRAVKRHIDRFPADFMFQLADDEFAGLRCQIGTSNGRGGRRYAPFAFTEHGVMMAANVLNSPRANQVSVLVVRTFIKLRAYLATHKELAHKLDELERRVGNHDEAIRNMVVAMRELMSPAKKGKIGFNRDSDK